MTEETEPTFIPFYQEYELAAKMVYLVKNGHKLSPTDREILVKILRDIDQINAYQR
jgi:hypothetical protein